MNELSPLLTTRAHRWAEQLAKLQQTVELQDERWAHIVLLGQPIFSEQAITTLKEALTRQVDELFNRPCPVESAFSEIDGDVVFDVRTENHGIERNDAVLMVTATVLFGKLTAQTHQVLEGFTAALVTGWSRELDTRNVVVEIDRRQYVMDNYE